MEPTASTCGIKNRVELKRPVDSTSEPLLDSKLPRLQASAVELSRLRKTPLDEAETSSNERNAVEASPRLDLLPEYVLCHLFSYLNIQELYNVSLCSPRLYNVIRSEKKLWRNVKDVCNGSSPCHSRLLPFLNDFTTVLHFISNTPWSCLAQSHTDECYELNYFHSLKSLQNLKSFILENHSLNYKMLNLALLPECVTELRLRRINLHNLTGECTIFHDLHQNLPNLEVIDVSFCFWVIPQMLCSFAQCSHLKELRMVGCSGMDSIMPYAAHAVDSGFSKLETLDLRLTSYISLNEIAVFKKFKNLKHIFLENANRCKQHTSTSDRLRPIYPLRRFRVKPRRLSNYISTWLETLVVRNYSCITDETLAEIEESFKSIKYLDVTGTKCTAERIATFQIRCPQIRVMHESIISS